jgi:hypothetical protein
MSAEEKEEQVIIFRLDESDIQYRIAVAGRYLNPDYMVSIGRDVNRSLEAAGATITGEFPGSELRQYLAYRIVDKSKYEPKRTGYALLLDGNMVDTYVLAAAIIPTNSFVPLKLTATRSFNVPALELRHIAEQAVSEGYEFAGRIDGVVALREISRAVSQEENLHPVFVKALRLSQSSQI